MHFPLRQYFIPPKDTDAQSRENSIFLCQSIDLGSQKKPSELNNKWKRKPEKITFLKRRYSCLLKLNFSFNWGWDFQNYLRELGFQVFLKLSWIQVP